MFKLTIEFLCFFLQLSFGVRLGKPRPKRIVFYSRGVKVKSPMQLKVSKKLPLSIQAADEYGNPTEGAFDAPPSWSSSDESIAKVQASEDGMSADVQSAEGKLASATVQVSGVVAAKQVLGSLLVEFVPGDVAEIAIQAGEPVENDFDPNAPQA